MSRRDQVAMDRIAEAVANGASIAAAGRGAGACERMTQFYWQQIKRSLGPQAA
jgi:hypothetical protein